MLISDFIVELLSSLLQSIIPTSKSKLEKNINQLMGEEWFSQMNNDYRYNYIIWHNRKVKRFLSKPENVKILKSKEDEKEKFIRLVIQEHQKFVKLY
ncbi:hypothetical protein [Neobacillus sp. NPDC093127]|uniref:hypothetical protein n=1 Tax=Neobacillus sp. NPDC093127 TaxID=3364296 RepID=UPI00381D151B